MHSLMDRIQAQPGAGGLGHLDDGRASYVLGLQALRNGDAEDAIGLLTSALRYQPQHQGMRRNLVRALLVAGRFDQVVDQANAALCGTVDDAEMHFAKGTALNALREPSRACAAFAQALALKPDHAATWLNMGNASADLEDLVYAEAMYRTAVRLDPGLAEAHASLGYVLTRLGRVAEALEACEAAIGLRPDFPQAHWNLAVAALLGGDLPRGFTAYEWRKRHGRYRQDFPDLPGPQWDGADPRGQTILVRAEQGFGDAIQFARYLCLIRDRGGFPVLACSPGLVPLIEAVPGVRAVSGDLPDYDCWVDQMSLPRLFGTRLDSIPLADGYLQADPALIDAWRARLPAGCKVGIAFAGNPAHPGDRRRSIPLEVGFALPAIAGVSFVNLQHGVNADRFRLPNLTPWLTDYAETAALIANLDLVITVDTSVAHLAGALGKPVWVLLPFAPDWRWLLHRTDSPWYLSVRLFRQETAGEWDAVLAQVVDALGDTSQFPTSS